MTPTQSKVVQHILAVFESKGVPAPRIDEHSPVDGSLGLESLDFAELAIRLEGEFGRDPFAESEIPPLRTVADLAALYGFPTKALNQAVKQNIERFPADSCFSSQPRSGRP